MGLRPSGCYTNKLWNFETFSDFIIVGHQLCEQFYGIVHEMSDNEVQNSGNVYYKLMYL